jgi:hypothetical protein
VRVDGRAVHTVCQGEASLSNEANGVEGAEWSGSLIAASMAAERRASGGVGLWTRNDASATVAPRGGDGVADVEAERHQRRSRGPAGPSGRGW